MNTPTKPTMDTPKSKSLNKVTSPTRPKLTEKLDYHFPTRDALAPTSSLAAMMRKRGSVSFTSPDYGYGDDLVPTVEPLRKRMRFQRRNSKTPQMLMAASSLLPLNLLDESDSEKPDPQEKPSSYFLNKSYIPSDDDEDDWDDDESEDEDELEDEREDDSEDDDDDFGDDDGEDGEDFGDEDGMDDDFESDDEIDDVDEIDDDEHDHEEGEDIDDDEFDDEDDMDDDLDDDDGSEDDDSTDD